MVISYRSELSWANPYRLTRLGHRLLLQQGFVLCSDLELPIMFCSFPGLLVHLCVSHNQPFVHAIEIEHLIEYIFSLYYFFEFAICNNNWNFPLVNGSKTTVSFSLLLLRLDLLPVAGYQPWPLWKGQSENEQAWIFSRVNGNNKHTRQTGLSTLDWVSMKKIMMD